MAGKTLQTRILAHGKTESNMSYESSQARTILERTLKKGVTLKTIAERSDVSVRTISRLRNGHTVSVMSALSVMNGLGVIWAERKKANLAATESSMRKPVITHDHASASFEQVEQAALDRGIKADIGLRDTELECAKYRRVMQLEQQLNDANTAYLSSKSQHDRDLQRLTALSEMHGQSWKAACVQAEQLQKQLDHGQAQFASLQSAYDQQVDDEREMLAQIDTLFVERENAATLHDQQVMCLLVYVWSPICAIVLLIVSGLVVWGVR